MQHVLSNYSTKYFELVNNSFVARLSPKQKVIVQIVSLVLGGVIVYTLANSFFSKSAKVTKKLDLIQANTSKKLQIKKETEAAEIIQSAIQGVLSFYQKKNQEFVEDGNKKYIQPDSHKLLAMFSSLYSENLYLGFGINQGQYKPNPDQNMQMQLCDVVYFSKRQDQIDYDQKSWNWYCNPFNSTANLLKRKDQQRALLNKIDRILKQHSKKWKYESHQLCSNIGYDSNTFIIPECWRCKLDAAILFYKEVS